jgi:hypothetical protein
MMALFRNVPVVETTLGRVFLGLLLRRGRFGRRRDTSYPSINIIHD